MRVVAGLDVGTTSIRVGMFDQSGKRVATARRRLGISHPFAGAVEQDPVEIRDVAIDLLREAVFAYGSADIHVSAVGIANQRSTVVAWDSSTGEPLRPAIGWQDTRTAERVAEFRANGIPLNTSASCSKIEWLLENDEAVRRARDSGTLRLGTIDTWLTCALTSESAFVTDPSNAGATGFYDASAGDWSEFVVEMFGADRSLLADVVATDAPVGSTPIELIGAEVPIVARAGDQQAASYAHGLGAGDAKLTLGTSGMLDLGTGAEIGTAPEGTYALPLWRLNHGGRSVDEFCLEGSINTAGAVIEWLVAVGLLESAQSLDEIVAQSRSDSKSVFIPALAGFGSPRLDPTARGTFAGIGLDTTAADLVAAAVQGISARVAEIADLLDVGDSIRLDGGLSRSTAMVQSVADLTGRVVRPAPDPETTLRGAAMLAAAGVGSPIEVPNDAVIGDEVEPLMSSELRAEIRGRFEATAN